MSLCSPAQPGDVRCLLPPVGPRPEISQHQTLGITPLRSCFSRFFSNRDLPIACPAGTHIPAGRQGGVGRATSAPGMDWGTLPPQGTQFPDTSQVQGKDVRAAPGTPNREAVSQESGDPGYPPAKCWFFPCDGRESIWSHWPVSYSCGSFCNKKHF